MAMADAVCKSRLVLDTARWSQGSASGASPTRRAAASVGFPACWTASESLKSSASSGFHGVKVDAGGDEMPGRQIKGGMQYVPAQMSLTIGKSMRWWEKGVQTNMKEISSAEDLVESLLNAGDKLVIVDFFSPGCGGCRALHPKICQFAETNPEVAFLQVNYELHKSMCYSLNVHVLPFFRFYRGAQGRLCSFSCTNATIKKFKDALAKHNPDRCSLGPAKGLEESELLKLAANRDLSFTYTRKPEPVLAYHELEQIVPSDPNVAVSATLKSTKETEGKMDLFTASR